MLLGILPFLIQWIALSQFHTNQNTFLKGNQQILYGNQHSKNHWTLLSELSKLPEKDIEQYLPQICNIVLDRESLNNDELSNYFENIIVNKCAECVPFGLRVCGLLKSSASSPVEGLFRNVFLSTTSLSQASRKEERFSSFQDRVEYATRHGHDHQQLHHQGVTQKGAMRARYVEDYTFMLDSLGRLGLELRAYPVSHRNFHLRNAISQCNSMLHNRMTSLSRMATVTAESIATPRHTPHLPPLPPVDDSSPDQQRAAQDITRPGSDLARFSLHLPLQHSKDRIRRIVRFVESDCEVLPSRDRSPFLVVAETVEEEGSAACGHHSLYTHDKRLTNGMWDDEESSAVDEDGDETVEECDSDVMSGRGGGSSSDMLKGSDYGASLRGGSDIIGHHPQHVVSVKVSPRYRRSHRMGAVQSTEAVNRQQPVSNSAASRVVIEMAPTISSKPQTLIYSGFKKDNEELHGEVHKPQFDSSSTVVGVEQQSGDDCVPNTVIQPLEMSSEHHNHFNPLSPPLRQTGDTQVTTTTVSTSLSGASTSNSVMPSNGADRRAFLRASSPFGHLPGWDVASFVVKSGDDVRKESLAMQLIGFMQGVFRADGLDIFLRPYQILSTGRQSGLIEYLEGTMSIDRIKKGGTVSSSGVSGNGVSGAASGSSPTATSLREHFEASFGPPYSLPHARAVQNFARSLAGYSLVTYLLQVKDRHNGNILLDSEGHLIHIDYGFILGDSPGFNINFESAPFKLTREYVAVLGGVDSAAFRLFEDSFLRGFLALQRHAEAMSAIAQLFYGDKRKGAAENMCSRLLFPTSHADILGLVRDSLDNWRTKQYDWFQQQSNNILM